LDGKGQQPFVHLVGGLEQLGLASRPMLVDGLQQLQESGTAVPRFRGEIGAAVKGFEVGAEKDRERPAALAGGGLHKGHVNLVDVRPFLPVHFDADEMAFEEFRYVRLLERFPLHHVTPMASRIPDAEKDRLRFGPGPGEGFRAPGIPVDRIELVLDQVRGFLPGEAIGGAVWCVGHGVGCAVGHGSV
jgi:hypothetical protein